MERAYPASDRIPVSPFAQDVTRAVWDAQRLFSNNASRCCAFKSLVFIHTSRVIGWQHTS